MVVCKHVTFGGRVQGVGFRYTAQRLAAGFPVAGYVRNLRSGDVELVAEGEQTAVEGFLAAIARQLAGYIERTDANEEPSGGYQGFQIRY